MKNNNVANKIRIGLYKFINLVLKARDKSFLKKVAKIVLPKKVILVLNKFTSKTTGVIWRTLDRFLWKQKIIDFKAKTGSLQLHLGCGNNRIHNMINCEYRPTTAADLVMDCADLSRFKDKSIDHIFSHAFFEHLYFDQRQPHIAACQRVLKKNSILLYLGIPDMKVIAESYLKNAELAPDWAFDAYMVYRYTHGSPEIANGWWQEQLHKTLFDRDVVCHLLKNAGFERAIIFNYCFIGESIPLNMGFAAWSGDMQHVDLQTILEQHSDKISSLEETLKNAEYISLEAQQ